MGKINFVSSRNETQRGIQLEDGRIISLFDDNNKFYLRYDEPLDLDKGVFGKDAGEEHKDVTLNNLKKQGKAQEVCCYDSCDYDTEKLRPWGGLPEKEILSQKFVLEIQKFFFDKGYKVTKEAIIHQLSAWNADLKSGYRDEENGYHLFSPCGCNPLSIRLSSLHPLCEDWQITYEC